MFLGMWLTLDAAIYQSAPPGLLGPGPGELPGGIPRLEGYREPANSKSDARMPT